MNQVVPVERRQQEGGRDAEIGEDVIGLPLGVEVRHLVLAHERGHAVVGERHPLTGVFQRRPDHVLKTGVLRRLGHGGRVGELLLRREVLPEEGDAERSPGSGERLLQTLRIADVGRRDLGAGGRQRPGLLRVDVPRDGAGRERPAGVVENGPHEATSLRAGRAHHCKDLLVSHVEILLCRRSLVGPVLGFF
jgi:hypothetical protein